jgi:hypothetical protein
MKKFKFSFTAFALVIGLTAAFAFNRPDPKPRFNEIWQELNSDGTLKPGGQYYEVANIDAAKSAFNCFSDQVPCAGQVDQPDGTLQGPKIFKP